MSSGTAVDPALFSNYVPLNALRPDSQNELAKKTAVVEAKAGDVLFKIGDAAKTAVFLLSGEIALQDPNGKALARIVAGDTNSFHRLAHQSPRRVSAKCLTPVRYMSIDAGLLDVMLTWDQTGAFELKELTTTQEDTGGDWMTKLLQIPTFQMVPPSNLQSMFMKMQEMAAEPGHVIVRQGDDGDFFYVMIEGRSIVTREQPNQKPVRLAELEAGSCFGEEALIADSKRNASVTMLTRGKLMRLAKDDFRKLLNDPLARKLDYVKAEALVKSGKAKWLDVRMPSEFQRFNLPGSVNVPLYMLRMKLATLDKGTTYILCCDTGRRSSVGVFVLTQKGYEAYVLDKGLPPRAS